MQIIGIVIRVAQAAPHSIIQRRQPYAKRIPVCRRFIISEIKIHCASICVSATGWFDCQRFVPGFRGSREIAGQVIRYTEITVGRGIVLGAPRIFEKVVSRFVITARRGQKGSKLVETGPVTRIQRYRPAQMIFRIGRTIQLFVNVSKSNVRVRQIFIGCQRRLEFIDGFVVLPRIGIESAEREMHVCILGVTGQRAMAGPLRVFEIRRAAKAFITNQVDFAPGGIGSGKIRVDSDCPLDIALSLCQCRLVGRLAQVIGRPKIQVVGFHIHGTVVCEPPLHG